MLHYTFQKGAKQSCSGAEIVLKVAFLVWTEALSGTVSAMLHFTVQHSVNIDLVSSDLEEGCDDAWFTESVKLV